MDLRSLLFGLGFFSPVAAGVCAAFFYARHCRAYPEPETRISVIAYVLALLVCAIVAFLIGLQYGVAWSCSSPSWGGNLCGLVGFFISGPSAAALAIFLVGGSIMFFPGDERPTDGTIRKISSAYLKLWRGQYSLDRSFWGFFILGSGIVWIAGIFGGLLFILYPPARLIFKVVSLGYLVTAAVGVWRSASIAAGSEQGSSAFARSVKIVAARAVAVMVVLLFLIGNEFKLVLHSLYSYPN